MAVNGVQYSYRLEVNDSSVTFEDLYNHPERRRRTLPAQRAADLDKRHTKNGTKSSQDNPSSGMRRFIATIAAPIWPEVR